MAQFKYESIVNQIFIEFNLPAIHFARLAISLEPVGCALIGHTVTNPSSSPASNAHGPGESVVDDDFCDVGGCHHWSHKRSPTERDVSKFQTDGVSVGRNQTRIFPAISPVAK